MASPFYRHIQEAEIADIDYPVAGANILLPFGLAISRRLETLARQPFEDRGYQEIDLPGVVPGAFVGHLRQGELFKAHNDFHEFYLSQGTEAQGAFAAASLIHSPRDLPVRVFSAGKIYRQNTRTPLIKDLELRILEHHAFLTDPDAAQEEKETLSGRFHETLTGLGIPSVLIHMSVDPRSEIRIYSLFPHADTFGSVYASHDLGDQFAHHLPKVYIKGTQVHQVNTAFTSRLLPAYLSNHMDEHGFCLTFAAAPAKVYLNTNGFAPDRLAQLRDSLTAQGLDRVERDVASNEEALKRFLATGLAAYVGAGRDQVKIRMRNAKDIVWTTPEAAAQNASHLINLFFNGLATNAPSAAVHESVIERPLQSKEYDPRTVYLVPAQREEEFAKFSLKTLGFLPSGQLAMVAKKF